MINKWKNNLAQWHKISNEMREWAVEKGLDWFVMLDYDGEWKNSHHQFYDGIIYRLKDEYVDKEVIELSIHEDKCGFCKVIFVGYNKYCYTLAPTIYNLDGVKVVFAGYKYADGGVRTVSALFQSKTKDCIIMEIPVSVMFRRKS